MGFQRSLTEERASAAPGAFPGRTAWARSLETPLRVFLRTETASAAVLVAATVAALVWINVSASSYDAVWGARLSVRLAGGAAMSTDTAFALGMLAVARPGFPGRVRAFLLSRHPDHPPLTVP